jgi:hypothetical protein
MTARFDFSDVHRVLQVDGRACGIIQPPQAHATIRSGRNDILGQCRGSDQLRRRVARVVDLDGPLRYNMQDQGNPCKSRGPRLQMFIVLESRRSGC